MSRLHRLVLGSGCGMVGYACAAPDSYGSVSELIRSVASNLHLPALASLASSAVPAAGSAAATAAASVHDAQTAALTLAIERLVAAQRSPGFVQTLLSIAAPLAAGAACCYFGWTHFGWVSIEQLQEGLAGVCKTVEAAVHTLSDSMRARFERVDTQLLTTAEKVDAVSAATEQLTAQVHAVSETMQSLERRMGPIEANAATAAHGVEVLCELVKTSGLLSNASPHSLERLDRFTGTESGGEGGRSGAAELPMASRPELLGPPPTLPAPAPILGAAAPTFMRALIN